VWTVKGYGSGKSSSRENAPIHFGDTPVAAIVAPPAQNGNAKSKPAAAAPGKNPGKKSTSAKASARGKGRR
jgi:hypothetical protein